jgi:hypothetical protein
MLYGAKLFSFTDFTVSITERSCKRKCEVFGFSIPFILFFQKLQPLLLGLLEKSYFRYFQYNPNRKCPFWDMSKEVCHSGSCGVKPCTKDNIPQAVLSSTEKQARLFHICCFDEVLI